MRKRVAVAAIAGSLLVGGATGAALFGPVLAGAQTTTTTPGTGDQAGTHKSHEDAAHEAAETPEHEAAEKSGQFTGGQFHGGHHVPHVDAAHEAAETPEQEAAEHAGGGRGRRPGTGPSIAPSSATGSATRPGHRF